MNSIYENISLQRYAFWNYLSIPLKIENVKNIHFFCACEDNDIVSYIVFSKRSNPGKYNYNRIASF